MDKKTKASVSKELKNKTVLVTGGAGSVGSALVKKILEFPVKTVRVLDIDEHALFKLNRSVNDKRLRLLLGSITDKERIHTETMISIIYGENRPISKEYENIKKRY